MRQILDLASFASSAVTVTAGAPKCRASASDWLINPTRNRAQLIQDKEDREVELNGDLILRQRQEG